MPQDPKNVRVTLDELDSVSEAAFQEARASHRRNGVPLVFVRDGRTVWELPDGTITDVDPFAKAPPVTREDEPRDATKGR